MHHSGKVIAVDIMKQNIDFIKTSLRLMNLTGSVEFVLNAISDNYEKLYPLFEKESNGGEIYLGSHWSSSYITVLSLVETFTVMKYFHSDATPALLSHKEPA